MDLAINHAILCVLDDQGHILFLNRSAEELLGRQTGEQLFGVTAEEQPSAEPSPPPAITRNVLRSLKLVFDEAVRSGSEVAQDVLLAGDSQDDQQHLILVTPVSLGDGRRDQPATHYVLVMSNVDSLIRAKEQPEHLERLANLGETISRLTHDVNQPLNTIALASQNLLSLIEAPEVDLEKVKAKLERVQRQVQRASELIKLINSEAKFQQANGQSEPARTTDYE